MAEHTERRECLAQGVSVKSISGYGVALIEKALGTADDALVKHHLRVALTDVQDGVLDECQFVGDVEVNYHGGEAVWECPVCRTEHREDVD